MNEFELKTLNSITKKDDILKIVSSTFDNLETYYYAFYKFRELILCLPLSKPLVDCPSMDLKAKYLSIEITAQKKLLEEFFFSEDNTAFKNQIDKDFFIIRSLIENQILYLLNAENNYRLSKAFSPFEIEKEIKKEAFGDISKFELFKKILCGFDLGSKSLCKRHNISFS